MNDESRSGSAVLSPQCPARDEAILNAVAHDPSVGVWAVDADSRVTYANEHGSRMLLGVAPDSVIGKRLDEIAPGILARRMAAMVERTLAGERVTGSSIWRGQRMRSVFQSMPDEHGERKEMVVVTRPYDLADVERQEEQIDEAEFVDLGELDVLTPREVEVLALLGKGMRTDEIAKHLTRSPKTVQRFQEGIRAKLGISDRCKLGQLARERGLEPWHANLPRVRRGAA